VGLVKAKFELTVPSFSPRVDGNVAVGATFATVSANVTVVMPPWPSFAVIVTVWDCAGPSVVLNDHVHVPAVFVPAFVTVPVEALNVTVSPAFASPQVPLFAAV
jgi:hypothetical protein